MDIIDDQFAAAAIGNGERIDHLLAHFTIAKVELYGILDSRFSFHIRGPTPAQLSI